MSLLRESRKRPLPPRYAAVDADRDYLIVYEVEDLSVLASPEYLARLNDPTPWTRRVTQAMKDPIRGLCSVAASTGEATAHAIAAVRLADGEPGDRLHRALLPAVRQEPGLAVHLCRTEASRSEFEPHEGSPSLSVPPERPSRLS